MSNAKVSLLLSATASSCCIPYSSLIHAHPTRLTMSQQQAKQYKAIGEDLWKNRTEKVVSSGFIHR